MFENEIGQTDKWVMETNDDQCTDGEIDDDICFVPIQKQTAVKGPEQKQQVHWVEQDDMQQKVAFMQVPEENKETQ